MSILALVTDPTEAGPLLIWAARIARARSATLRVLLWEYSQVPQDLQEIPCEGTAAQSLREVWAGLDDAAITDLSVSDEVLDRTTFCRLRHPDPATAVLEQIDPGITLLVAPAREPHTGEEGFHAGDKRKSCSERLLKQSPCHTVLVHCNKGRSLTAGRILLVSTDSPHDPFALRLAAGLAESTHAALTVLAVESERGEESIEVGKRKLRSLIAEAGIDVTHRTETRVVLANDPFKGMSPVATEHDLILIGSQEMKLAEQVIEHAAQATVVLYRKCPAPGLAGLRQRFRYMFTGLNPVDFADLFFTLQRGSRWNADFMVMLGLAAIISSLGLLQNSPAVIIGSMLLAPLMTPMIGMGLALNRANFPLTRACFTSISCGFLMVLVLSFLVARMIPGRDLTSELIARGQPNLLDLLIALFSAVAGAYALARPNMVGAVAGVAMATALVPPLCTVGVSLADGEIGNALGAAELFGANVLAIIIGTWLTFRFMGAVASSAWWDRPRWVLRIVIGLILALLLLVVPLGSNFFSRLRLGIAQPFAHPIPDDTFLALQDFIDKEPSTELIMASRPHNEKLADMVVIVASSKPVPDSYTGDLVAFLRNKTGDQGLNVKVQYLQSAAPRAAP